MEIKNVVTKPYEKSISPAISFEVQIAHVRFQEAIINIDGWIESDDGNILANLIEILPDKLKSNELGARDSSFDSKFTETVYNTKLVALLERRALDYIEKRRMKDRKRDVNLTLNLNVRIIGSMAKISHLHQIDSQLTRLPSVEIMTFRGRKTLGKIIAYAHDPDFSTNYSNLWVISGDGKPTFLSINELSIRKEGIRIPSTDWIHDFAPKLELGEYFVVEIPKGKEVVKEAWKYVKKAEECYRQWDTKGAYANCREVGKLLNGVIKKKLQNDPIIKKWKRAIDKFEQLTSMDLHEEDIKQQKPVGEIIVGRPETEHVLIVTKALIKYAEELLQEKS